jgi:plasmid stability protein
MCDHLRVLALIAEEVLSVAALSIRNLDDHVKERLRMRAAAHGRSMESEIRAILAGAVSEPEASGGLFAALLDRVGEMGGVDLDLPARSTPARSADLSA